ncbi:extracellular solute-binding protein [Paenibacillus sp. J31TS4]|uniref:extracellular solute-binding protein n=1 Tax=Paenibacillus sp. J31TS4 TaxID=2807195 RepID=UPI0020C17136|nr:extracellular solute-binding protein [Paenibacillus sp. J31TS4]
MHQTSRMRLNELVRTLREEIRTGKRRAGEFLPSEKTLAVQYHLSNQSVRKGLDILVGEGLIEKLPRVGTKVIGQPEAGQTTIKFGFHSSVTGEADIHGLLARFHEKHPHIRVQAVPVSSDHFGYVKTYLSGGIFDAIMMNYTDFRYFTETNDAQLLQPLQRDPGHYEFLSDAFTLNGRLLVRPFIFSPLILCYNREHFREAGLNEPDSSWRWEDLIRNAAKLAIPNERIGFHSDFYSPNRWPLLPLQMGARFERGAGGRIRLADTRMMEALRICRDMKNELPLLSEGITTGESERLLANGKVSMVITSYFYLNYLKGETAFDLAPVPYLEKPVTLLLNIGLAVNSRSANREAAEELVNFLTSEEAQQVIRQQTYSLPALRTAAEWNGDSGLYRPSRFSLFRETIPGFRYFTDMGVTVQELAEINREVKLFWAALESEETFCARIEEKARHA